MAIRQPYSRTIIDCVTYPLVSVSAGVYYLVQSAWRLSHELGVLGSYTAPIPVISVGNICMGGAGKTPFVMFLVDMLAKKGFRPCVVSRGYRGSYNSEYLLVSDGRSVSPKIDPKLVGDEPFLMASNLGNKAAVIVGKDRLECIRYVNSHLQCNLIILDDGFQHLKLKRDIDIVLVTGTEDHMFPLGGLREPLSALTRADIIALDGNQEVTSRKVQQFLASHDHYTYQSNPVGLLGGRLSSAISLDTFKGKDVLLVSGIANPARFKRTVESLDWRILDHIVYRDHHEFSSKDITRVVEVAKGAPIVFTEKDWVKLSPEFQRRDDVFFLRIGLRVTDSEKLVKELVGRLGINGSQQKTSSYN
ncbi:MAG: tetraacyldisaccharide 4'-kinase [Desulfomonilaceae bacterium]